MSMFGSIMSKIFHAGGGTATKAGEPAATGSTATNALSAATNAPSAAPPTEQPAPPATQVSGEPVDVEAVLSKMASEKAGGGNWQSSIVDLLKLLDLDSSLNARKELANELNIHVGGDGTAEENIALHKGVMQKLAENGGKVPDSMKG